MATEQYTLEHTLAQAFPNATIQCTAQDASGEYWKIRVQDAAFCTLSKMEAHRRVQKALKPLDIHAITLETGDLTP